MKVILTHEQADMDALASQLAAWLLWPDALPLLPRHINRNGRQYLQDQAAELPYITYEDLPREPVETIILVDTQSLITLRGMQEDTRIVVYDHHPRKEDLDRDWEVHLVETGANVTQMVERLAQAGRDLTTIQATTLLLGLYEDTGSFTYGSSTPADLTAAAYCLDQGGDLDVVSRYLYPPLTSAQRALYQRLLENVQRVEIEDQIILVASGNALDVQDEISTVAHKLRDVLNPSALLLLVSTQQGIRLVARSTSDQVDVSKIAEAMGGGGHKRAASALVRPEGHLEPEAIEEFLTAQYKKLIRVLKRHVRPAVTVGGIMSRDPLILSPDTPAEEAHRLMQRYGYEGYPVVAGGRVVGLLNRREVDRALSHGLDLTVESLMDAGDVTITPEESLETLQRLMGSSGWGQVPVASPDSGEIIGIVTRTDLLKTLMPKPDIPSREEVAEKLVRAVPPARLALLKAVAIEADQVNLPMYVVGGFVRDLLLDRPSLDFDIVVEGDAIFFARRLADRFGGRVQTHRRFGTAKWTITGIQETLAEALTVSPSADPGRLPDSLDLITARTEFYEQPAALPTVESSSIKMDLHRRDFTINTLALRLDGDFYGTIHDYWGGLDDLRSGRIRVLHALSFVDDATRLLRAVRFEQRFGFAIEGRTLALMKESLPLLNRLSGARLRHEINQILAESHAPAMLARLDALGILQAIHPALPWDREIKDRMSALDPESIPADWDLRPRLDHLNLKQSLRYIVWLGRLEESALRSIAARLRFNNDLTEALLATGRLHRLLPKLVEAAPSAVVHQLEKMPRLSLFGVYLIHPEKAIRQVVSRYVHQWADITPRTTGRDLRAMGLPPSPAYGEILGALRDAWLDGEIESAAEEEQLLTALMAKYGA